MFFSNSHPVAVLISAWCWVVLFAYLCGYSGLRLFGGFVVGFAAYTYNEYFIHCVLFHIVSMKIKWPIDRLYYKVHGVHHKYPDNEPDRVVLPIAHQWGLVCILTSFWYSLIFILETLIDILLPTWAPLCGVISPALRWQNTCVLGSGLMFGYSFYEIAHLYSHGYPLLKSFKCLEYAKWFHQYHHTHKASQNYGFVSPIWDFFSGTICNEPELNPFIKPPFGWTFFAILTALPLPIPFYHFIMMYFRNKNHQWIDYGRNKKFQTENFGDIKATQEKSK